MRKLIGLAYAGYITVSLPCALGAVVFMRGGIEAAATLVEFLTIVVFPVGLAFLLLGPAGFVAAIVVVGCDKRPLVLFMFLWLCIALFGAMTENALELPPWLITTAQALVLALWSGASVHFVRRGLAERKQLA